MSSPQIAVDLRILDRAGMERTGVGRYALESVLALRRARPEWRLTVHSNRLDLIDEGQGLDVRRTGWPTGSNLGRVAWLHLRAARATRPTPDLWLAPAFVSPPSWHGPSVVTIHDLVFLLEPERYRGRLNAWYASRMVRASARRADRVLCASTAVGERIVRHLEINSAKVVAAPWGVSAAFRRPTEGQEGRYILFVGRWEARKGLEMLHGALREVAARGHRLPLVLAGGPGWGTRGTVSALLADPHVDAVIDPTDGELAALYAGALALVYPSRMEGFGFPVAEAMACGCPVIASDLPEIRGWAGDAPLYVPAGDRDRLADALIFLATDPQRRDEMARRGRRIAAGMTWDAYGETAARTIEAVLSERSARDDRRTWS
jgi:glycosyltransferase involved in cell wall biosynthesis